MRSGRVLGLFAVSPGRVSLACGRGACSAQPWGSVGASSWARHPAVSTGRIKRLIRGSRGPIWAGHQAAMSAAGCAGRRSRRQVQRLDPGPEDFPETCDGGGEGQGHAAGRDDQLSPGAWGARAGGTGRIRPSSRSAGPRLPGEGGDGRHGQARHWHAAGRRSRHSGPPGPPAAWPRESPPPCAPSPPLQPALRPERRPSGLDLMAPRWRTALPRTVEDHA